MSNQVPETYKVPEAYKDEVASIRTLGQKVNDVTVRLRCIGEQLNLSPSAEGMASETYLDEIISQIEECRSWVQVISVELDKL